jgi:hypothetical protein
MYVTLTATTAAAASVALTSVAFAAADCVLQLQHSSG